VSLSQVEAKAHAEQQAGLDREAMKRQKVSLIEQRKKNHTKVGEVQQRRDNQDPAFPVGIGQLYSLSELGYHSTTRLAFRRKTTCFLCRNEILRSISNSNRRLLHGLNVPKQQI
jgi:hypothetical protein